MVEDLTATLTSRLIRRYKNCNRGLPRYVGAEQVPLYCEVTGKMRYADYLVVDSQTEEIKQESGRFKRMPPPVHGFEVKATRSDWLSEKRTGGEKSLAWRERCHYWWLVAPSTDVIRPEEVPPGWGLIVGTARLRAVVKPKRAEPNRPIDATLMLTIARHSARATKTVPSIPKITHRKQEQ